MPFLSIVHLRELRCKQCGELLAPPGARSFIVDADGNPLPFSEDDPPTEMIVRLSCSNGHPIALSVPNEVSAEETLHTPDEAPAGADAVLMPQN